MGVGNRGRVALLGVGSVLALGVLSCRSMERLSEEGRAFVTGLGEPMGIAVNADGSVAVADKKAGRVLLLAPDGSELGRFGKGVLERPLGVTFARDGSILVADELTDRVERFDARGEHLGGFGGPGEGPGEFSGAGPLAVAPDGRVYVIDVDHNRVQVFAADGSFLFFFGRTGHFRDSAPGEFYFPGGIAIDTQGRVFISDTHNFRIQRFSADGTFETAFGKQGSGRGEFDHVFGLAIDSVRGLLYAADDRVKLEDGGNRVLAFTLDGEARGALPGLELPRPFDVAVLPGGTLLVTTRGDGRVRHLDGVQVVGALEIKKR